MSEVCVGEIYRHFKGEEKLYKVIAVARDCEDSSREVVVYEMLYETEDFPKGTIWIRGLEDFCGEKVFEDGQKVKRFELVEEREL